MSSFDPGFDFAAANAELLAKFESAPQAAWFGGGNRHARQHCAFENLGPLVWLEVLLIRHDNLLLATDSQTIPDLDGSVATDVRSGSKADV